MKTLLLVLFVAVIVFSAFSPARAGGQCPKEDRPCQRGGVRQKPNQDNVFVKRLIRVYWTGRGWIEAMDGFWEYKVDGVYYFR